VGRFLEPYPVVPTFSDWEFPHDKLPKYWQRCVIPKVPDHEIARPGAGALLSRDISCRITAHREGTENAHLVPGSECSWFNQNQMASYTSTLFEPEPINNHRNAILLRSDIHTLFDSKRCTIIPKGPSPDGERPLFVVHTFVNEAPSEVVQLYHNVAVQPLSGVAVEYLFARFAWTIFGLLTIFLNTGVQRTLRVRDDAGYTIKKVSGSRCQEMAKQSRPRSMSPKKRKQEIPDEMPGDMQENEGTDEFEAKRGRKGRRSSPSPQRTSTSDSDISLYDGDTDQSDIETMSQMQAFGKEPNSSPNQSRTVPIVQPSGL
jgi:hypothetical protein